MKRTLVFMLLISQTFVLWLANPSHGYNLPDSTLDPPGNLGPLCFYPDNPEDRLYVFPWDSGVTHTVLDPAFNRPTSDHKGYAVDWDLSTGTRVLASRSGNITFFLNPGTDNAGIKITRSDRDSAGVYATSDYYIHIVIDSSLTRLGQRVERGQVIGRVGSMNHLHLEVQVANHVGIGMDGRTTEDVPVPFVEFTARPDGIPWHGDSCTSINRLYTTDGLSGALRTVSGRKLFIGISPNPLHSAAWIDVILPKAGQTSVRLYNPSGRLVREIFSGPLGAGQTRLSWRKQGQNGAGAYYIKLNSGNKTTAKRITVIR